MKRTRKVQIAVGVLGVAAAAVGFALIGNPVKAQAADAALFAMEKGAAVRAVANEAGIRWETNVNKAWYDNFIATNQGAEIVSFGTLVTGADNVITDGAVDVTKLTMETKAATEAKDLPCKVTPDFSKTSTFTYYASIVYTEKDMEGWTTEEKQKAYAAELVARSYVQYTLNGETKYAYATAEDSARCMRAVALAACEDTGEDVLTTDEKAIVDDYFGDPAQTAVDFGGYYEMVAPETVTGEYAVAYNGPKKVGEIEAGTLAIDDGLTLGDNYTLTLFAADGSYAKTTSFQYVTQTLDYKNFKSVMQPATATTVTGYYVLTTDVDVKGSTAWTATATLAGTLDGNNHKFTGLNVARLNGLFKNVENATIKNLAIIDVTLTDKSAVIVWQTNSNVTLDNVYISLGAQTFGECTDNYKSKSSEMGITNAGTIGIGYDWDQYKSGVVSESSGTVTVKNSVIYMPEFLAKANGFVAGYMWNPNTTINVDNCTFIGGNGRVAGYRYNQGTQNVTNTTITDAVTAHKTYKTTWGEMQQAAYETNHPYLELNNTNIASKLPTLTTEIAVLTEDIDGAASGINTRTRSKTTFTGVFDGQGKTIDNLQSNNWDRGMLLCGYLRGSAKNVVIKCNWTVNYDGGVIADEINGGYVENVYVEQSVETTTTDPQKIGAIAHKLTAGSMKNVVAYTVASNKDSVSGLFGKWNGNGNKYIVMENCYYITPNEAVSYVGVGTSNMTLENIAKQETFFGIQGFKGENAKDQFDAAVNAEDGTVKLNDMLKGWMYPAA